MNKPKRDKSTSIRLPAKLKLMVDEEAAKDNDRGFNETVVLLLAEAINNRITRRKFTIRDFT